MGYHTEFRGEFAVQPPLRGEYAAYPRAFNLTRRVRRDAMLTALRVDPVRAAAGLPIGEEGGYSVGETGLGMDEHGLGVLDENRPPAGQPDLWCHWIPTSDGSAIIWDGQPKFYEYERWMAYLIDRFLAPWGYVLTGTVECQGEDWCQPSDLMVDSNRVFFRGVEV